MPVAAALVTAAGAQARARFFQLMIGCGVAIGHARF